MALELFDPVFFHDNFTWGNAVGKKTSIRQEPVGMLLRGKHSVNIRNDK